MGRSKKSSAGALASDEPSYPQAPRRSARLDGADPEFTKDTLYQDTFSSGKRNRKVGQTVVENPTPKKANRKSGSSKAPSRPKSKGKQKAQPTVSTEEPQETQPQAQGFGRPKASDQRASTPHAIEVCSRKTRIWQV